MSINKAVLPATANSVTGAARPSRPRSPSLVDPFKRRPIHRARKKLTAAIDSTTARARSCSGPVDSRTSETGPGTLASAKKGTTKPSSTRRTVFMASKDEEAKPSSEGPATRSLRAPPAMAAGPRQDRRGPSSGPRIDGPGLWACGAQALGARAGVPPVRVQAERMRRRAAMSTKCRSRQLRDAPAGTHVVNRAERAFRRNATCTLRESTSIPGRARE